MSIPSTSPYQTAARCYPAHNAREAHPVHQHQAGESHYALPLLRSRRSAWQRSPCWRYCRTQQTRCLPTSTSIYSCEPFDYSWHLPRWATVQNTSACLKPKSSSCCGGTGEKTSVSRRAVSGCAGSSSTVEASKPSPTTAKIILFQESANSSRGITLLPSAGSPI